MSRRWFDSQQMHARSAMRPSCILFFVSLLLPVCPARALQSAPVVKTASTNLQHLALVPFPREVTQGVSLPLNSGVGVVAAGKVAADVFTARDLVSRLQNLGVHAQIGNHGHVRIELLRSSTSKAQHILTDAHITFDSAMHDEGYALVPVKNTLYDIAPTDAGIYYGAQTLMQLVTRQGDVPYLQSATIRDWPAMQYRGLDDDLSRGPVPTLAFQKHQVRVLSEYKINLYSPYFENNLAYTSDPLAAPPGGAMTRHDVEALVQYARQYHVTIVPEQEAFGHLHHTLIYDAYAPLAETPHGSVLAPGQPGSLPLIRSWFTEIAGMFPGPFLHIGADETFDLGRGQTAQKVRQEGLGSVYIQFLKEIHAELAPLHKTILFWGDIAMNSPQLVPTLPKDMIAVAWVYSPQPQGYDKWLNPYVQAGMETWVAPGINNWRRVYPDFNAGLDNIQKFVADGQRLGSRGELNTVWNDEGEGLFNLDWYGVLFGAAAGWQPGLSSIAQFQQSYGQAFHGDTTGKINEAQIELMAAQATLQSVGLAATSDHIFWLDPWSPEGQQVSKKILPVVQTLRLHAERAIALIAQARNGQNLRELDALNAMDMGARRLDFLGYKFQAAEQMVQEYNLAYREQNDAVGRRDVGHELGIISSVNGQCQDIRDGYGLIRDLYRAAWLQENRPYWLDNVTAHYDLAMQQWIKRGERFGSVARTWYATHTLPPPQDVGLPELSPESQADAVPQPGMPNH